MHAFLIVGNNTDTEVNAKIHAWNISQWDIVTPSGMGVSDIREFCRNLSLSPRGKQKVGVIKNMEALTIEAQNALLKTLEEPPPSTYIIGTTKTESALLPTILSRMQIVQTDSTKESVDTVLLHEIMAASPGKKLHIIETYCATADDAKKFVASLIAAAHQDMTDPALIRRLLAAQTQLAVNVNPKLVVDTIFF